MVLASLSAAVACHRGVPASSAPGPDTQGIFEYEATAINQTLRGRIVIADSVVIVEPVGDECWILPRTFYRDEPYFVTFACAGDPVSSGTDAAYGTIRARSCSACVDT